MQALRTLLALAVATPMWTVGATAAGIPPAPSSPGFTIDCGRGESLAAAPLLGFPNAVLYVKGTCAGPVTITADGLQLIARGPASITGGGKDAVTVIGARRVTLSGLTITGGAGGVVVRRGAHVTLTSDTITGNAQAGVLVQSGSSVALAGGASTGNGLAGVVAESTSAVTITGTYSASGNGVFGIDLNGGASLTLNAARLTASENTVGVQLGTGSAGFMDAGSTLDSSGNVTVGLTVVSGSHMVSFGGAITSRSNGLHGVSLNSKAGLDLDATARVDASDNRGDGVHLEQLSVMTVFNNPAFSQAEGTTLLTASRNGQVGIDLLTGSRILVDDFAALAVTGNGRAGVVLDDGSALSFGQTLPSVPGVATSVTGNTGVDLQMRFGSRLTYLGNDTFGVVRCDASVLVRGPGTLACPM